MVPNRLYSGMDCRLFWNVSIRDPRHNSDHTMVLGCLHSAPLREQAKYLGGRKHLLIRPPTALWILVGERVSTLQY